MTGQYKRTIHTTSDLTGLLVTPTDRREVSLVVHETAVEEGLDVRVGRLDMNLKAIPVSFTSSTKDSTSYLATRSWVLEVLEPEYCQRSTVSSVKSTYIVIYLPGGSKVWSA